MTDVIRGNAVLPLESEPALKIQQLTQQPLVCLVVGGVMADQHDVGWVVLDEIPPQFEPNTGYIAYGRADGDPYGAFRMTSEIVVGTIDQLVEHYRQVLVRAYEQMTQPVNLAAKSPDVVQAYLREVCASLPVDPVSGITHVPFGWVKPAVESSV